MSNVRRPHLHSNEADISVIINHNTHRSDNIVMISSYSFKLCMALIALLSLSAFSFAREMSNDFSTDFSKSDVPDNEDQKHFFSTEPSKEEYISIEDLEKLDSTPINDSNTGLNVGDSPRIIENNEQEIIKAVTPSKYVSISEYQSIEEIHGDWESFKDGVKDIKQAIDTTLGVTDTNTGREPTYSNGKSGGSTNQSTAGSDASNGGSAGPHYENRENIPDIILWLRKIIDFKDDSPIIFYGAIVFVFLIGGLVGAVATLGRSGRDDQR